MKSNNPTFDLTGGEIFSNFESQFSEKQQERSNA
jgi:hypothetical protein